MATPTNEPKPEVVMPSKLSYLQTDKGLMYLIQEVTGHSSAEILGYFVDLVNGMTLIEAKDIGTNGGRKGLRKKLTAYYSSSPIPFTIFMEGSVHKAWDENTRKYSGSDALHISASVIFPEAPVYQDQSKLVEMLIESTLLGAAVVPAFERPEIKIPRLYKGMVPKE